MLIYESEGFLEAEASEIRNLCRSKAPVSFGDEGSGQYSLQAILCEYQDKTDQRCRAAFLDKALKRAVVFAVSASEKKSSWQHGLEVLTGLGFELENVNLRLSPAMLEVVLRDVPGLATPVEARKQRTESLQLLDELQKEVDADPESPQGKKAFLKLSAEKRLVERVVNLRGLLECEFSPDANVNEELDALLAQIKDLTGRLEAADKRVEEERTQREFSESITEAAEKRIQELEEILVDVETKSADEIKLKRKIVSLQGQVKKLEEELNSAQNEMESEREKQGHFVDDVKASQAEISALANDLKIKQGETEHLAQELAAAELRIKALDKELQAAREETDASPKQVQVELEEVRQALAEEQKVNEALEAELAAAAASEVLVALQEQHDKLVKEFASVREDYEQERSVRRRLERCAFDDEKHIAELEKSLADFEDKSSAQPDRETGVDAGEIAALRCRLDEELEVRQEMENDLDDAHKLIDSLEQMIREKEGSASGWGAARAAGEDNGKKVKELEEKLSHLEIQLEQEQLEQNRLAKEMAAAERILAEQEKLLQQAREEKPVTTAVVDKKDAEPEAASLSKRSLPHELRPEPQKGAFFRPDWELAGLPCKSSGDVLKAWETVFNVQISIEGYPSQYCMAFLVVLRKGKQKKVYLLYRLKLNKHTLVCVPAKTPKDEKSLQKAIEEGLKFLKLSGFEMEELGKEHIEGALQSYFLEKD